MNLSACGLFLAALSPSGPEGDPAPIVIGQRYAFPSEALDEVRTVRVHRPDLPAPERRYPVLLVLDAEHNFPCVVGMVQELVRAEVLPLSLVVGVDSARRTWECTTSWPEYDPVSTGGAEVFLDFLEDELLPWLAEEFAAAPHRTLISHSLGGVVANHALARRPHLMDALLSVSPSVWWRDAGFDDELREAWHQDGDPLGGVYYLSIANEKMLPAYQELVAFLEAESPDSLRWHSDRFPEQDHITTYPRALQAGLRFVFADFDMQSFYEAGDLDGLRAHLEELSDAFGFEVAASSSFEYARLCRERTRAGAAAEAVELLRAGRRWDPRSLALCNFLGEALEAAGQPREAKRVYLEGLELARAQGSPMRGWIEQRLAALADP